MPQAKLSPTLMQPPRESATRTHATWAGLYRTLGPVPRQPLPLLRWRRHPEEFWQRSRARRAVPWFGQVLMQAAHQAALARYIRSVVAALLL